MLIFSHVKYPDVFIVCDVVGIYCLGTSRGFLELLWKYLDRSGIVWCE